MKLKIQSEPGLTGQTLGGYRTHINKQQSRIVTQMVNFCRHRCHWTQWRLHRHAPLATSQTPSLHYSCWWHFLPVFVILSVHSAIFVSISCLCHFCVSSFHEGFVIFSFYEPPPSGSSLPLRPCLYDKDCLFRCVPSPLKLRPKSCYSPSIPVSCVRHWIYTVIIESLRQNFILIRFYERLTRLPNKWLIEHSIPLCKWREFVSVLPKGRIRFQAFIIMHKKKICLKRWMEKTNNSLFVAYSLVTHSYNQ